LPFLKRKFVSIGNLIYMVMKRHAICSVA